MEKTAQDPWGRPCTPAAKVYGERVRPPWEPNMPLSKALYHAFSIESWYDLFAEQMERNGDEYERVFARSIRGEG